MKKTEFKVGEKNNRLTLINEGKTYISPNGRKNRRFVFLCDCGNKVLCTYSEFKNGHTKSCGCYHKDIARKRLYKHGLSYTNFYDIYSAMVARCNNKKRRDYPEWGGRGIKCLWKNFEEFRDDMHKSYLKHIKKFDKNNTRLDRIDNNGNYCKDNCKWSTHKEQARNRRGNHLITYKGITMPMIYWSEKFGIIFGTLSNRINRYGWTIERALTVPINGSRKYNKILIYKDKKLSIAEWSKVTGICQGTISSRIRYGWSINDILNIKPHEKNRTKINHRISEVVKT